MNNAHRRRWALGRAIISVAALLERRFHESDPGFLEPLPVLVGQLAGCDDSLGGGEVADGPERRLAELGGVCDYGKLLCGAAHLGEYAALDGAGERVAEVVREATSKIVALSGEISGHSEKAVEAVMEALALTGIAMQYVKLSRPASGTEHIISHYWECKKLERGVYSDFHGKKVGVATLIVADVYHKVAKMKGVKAHAEHADWADIYKTYGPNLSVDVKRLNEPCITDEINPDDITNNWDKICKIIEEEIPPVDKLLEYYKAAGAVTTIEQIKVDKQLCDEGLKYHPYMRKRVTLARIMPMCDLDFVKIYYSDKN